MEIIYHGHSCVQLSNQNQSIIIDPFLTGNPLAKTKARDIQVQYVLLTHAHGDHMADAASIAQNNQATIIATFELATYLSWQGLTTHAMNIGGAYQFDFGQVKMTQAFHSSSIVLEDQKQILYMGMPGGYLITMGGKTVYHAGDTSLFTDMKWLGEQHDISVAFLPIGDNLTMGPEDAAVAAEWLKADVTVPIHYNTFPVIQQNTDEFMQLLGARQKKGAALKPGETITI
ncbi:MAG: metal-dependent hydrolase [Bacilli bacterium]|nr:metal-dependent hydrolase [Bacilli bacterium]